uniref:Uncharacterized protein n=1 Tax=Anguilla anguilla TaxID=7936 RepID=A0A0E9Q1N5_ANGAN
MQKLRMNTHRQQNSNEINNSVNTSLKTGIKWLE